jgi:hypothetical protein
MKRSEAINKLMHKVISPVEIITKKNYDAGIYEMRAKNLLDFIEKELGMLPPTQTCKMVPDTYHGGEKHGPAQRVWDEE